MVESKCKVVVGRRRSRRSRLEEQEEEEKEERWESRSERLTLQVRGTEGWGGSGRCVCCQGKDRGQVIS